MTKLNVELWTDGAVVPNPGEGGWAYILRCKGREKQESGYIPHVTNNAAELIAVIKGLLALMQPCAVTVYSDSQYVVKGGNREWSRGKNTELWDALDTASEAHDVTFQWVRGHVGNPLNERCHQQANAQLAKGGC